MRAVSAEWTDGAVRQAASVQRGWNEQNRSEQEERYSACGAKQHRVWAAIEAAAGRVGRVSRSGRLKQLKSAAMAMCAFTPLCAGAHGAIRAGCRGDALSRARR